MEDKEFIAAKKSLKPVFTWIKQHKSVLYSIQNLQIPTSYISLSEEKLPIEIPQVMKPTKFQITQTTHSKESALLVSLLSEDLSNKKIIEILDSTAELCQKAWENGDDLTLNTVCVHLIKKLPDESLQELVKDSPDTAKQIITSLGKIGILFFKSCFTVPNATRLHPERFYTLLRISELQLLLAEDFAPFCQDLFENEYTHSDSLFFRLFDPFKEIPQLKGENIVSLEEETLLKGENIISFEEETFLSENETISSEDEETISSEDEEKSFTHYFYHQRASERFYHVLEEKNLQFFPRKELLSLIEGFDEKIHKQYPNFDNLSTETQRNARIILSDDLPDWFKLTLNIHLCAQYLDHEPIGTPPILNRLNDLTFSWTFKDIDNGDSKISWSLNGITQEIFNHYPELKEVDENTNLLFRNNHRPFQSPTIRKFINILLDHIDNYYFPDKFDEKDLLSKKREENLTGMPDEEYQELHHIVTAQKCQVVEALEYFTKHPEKLSHPDYQTLFKFFFFEGLLLTEQLEKHPAFAKKLSSFLNKSLSTYLIQNNPQAVAFLLQMSRYFTAFCLQGNCSPTSPSFPDSLQQVRKLLKNEKCPPEDRSFLYAELIAGLCRKIKVNNEDIKDIIEGLGHLTKYPIPDEWNDPEIEKEIGETQVIHQIAIQDFIGSNYTLESYLSSKNNEIGLPSKIWENPYFAGPFPGRKIAALDEEGFYTFIDDKGFHTRIFLEKDTLSIERKIKGAWHRLVFRESLEKKEKAPSLISRHLVNNFHHWLAPEANKLLITDKISGKILYEAHLDSTSLQVTDIVKCQDKTKLGTPSPLFKHFENLSYVEEWYDSDGTLQTANLPRYGLSFTTKKENKTTHILSDQFSGFHLKLDGVVPFLGSYPHFLVLENEKGVCKVLVPYNEFTKPEKYEVLEPVFVRKENLEIGDHATHKIIIFSLENNGTLSANSRKDAFYLAQLLAIVQEYASAASILKNHGEKPSVYSNEEQKNLRALINVDVSNGDMDPNGVAIRTYAGFLLIKNLLLSGCELNDKDILLVEKNYRRYLQKYQHLTELKLSQEEELFLLRTLLKNGFSSILASRLRELSPKESINFKDHQEEKKSDSPKTTSLTSLKSFFFPHYNTKPKPKDYLITRPQTILKDHCSYFYQVAKGENQEEKDHLKELLIFLKHSLNEKDHLVYLFFTSILEFPSEFPSFPENEDFSKSYDFMKEMVIQADKLMPKLLEKQMQETQLLKGEPIEAPLDGESIVLKPITLSFTLPIHSPFTKQCSSYFDEISEETSYKDLKEFLTSHVDGDINNEIINLQKGLTAFLENPPKLFTLKEDALSSIKKAALDGFEDEEKEIESLAIDIVALANAKHESSLDRALDCLEKEGGVRKVLTLEDVLISFGRADTDLLQGGNPALSEEQINSLHEKGGVYLLKASHLQQRKRVLNKIKEIDNAKTSKEIYSLTQELHSTLQERGYDPVKCPSYLVFEYYGDMLIRPDQIERLSQFFEKGDVSLIMEIIMGAGKSKVLLPLLALLRANGKELSLVIVTTAAAESIIKDTKKILGPIGQQVKTLYFDRNTECSIESLTSLLDTIQAAIDQRDCMIMQSKSIGCLALKFIEKMIIHLTENTDKELPEEIQLMKKILIKIRKHNPLLDEADTILNILFEICFSIGKVGSPSAGDTAVISLIYSILYEDSEIKSLAKLESDPEPNQKAPALNETLYLKSIKEPLAKKVWTKLKETNSKIGTYAKDLTEEEETLVLSYIMRKDDAEKESQEFFDSIKDNEVQDTLAICGEQISHILPHTLTQEFNKKYGMNPKTKGSLAIPYRAANAPNYGSHFANSSITTDYTFQSLIKNGISLHELSYEIDRLQSRAMNEMIEKQNQDPETLETWKIFCALKGDLELPLFNLNEEQIKILHNKINNSITDKLTFVEKLIIPQMPIPEAMISWNPQNFVSLFTSSGDNSSENQSSLIDGFTGTLWNGDSMHPALTPVAENRTNIETVTILWKQSRNEAYTLGEGSQDDVIKQFCEIGCDAIIDAAGNLNQDDNETIAKKISSYKKKPVVFYNKKREQSITDGIDTFPLSNSPWNEKEWDVFFNQEQRQGADVKIKDGGIGIVTIGRDMLLRDLLQAVKRLRKLGLSQTIKFALKSEVDDLIRQALRMEPDDKIRFDHILLYVCQNQEDQRDKNSVKSMNEQIINVPQMALFNRLLSDDILPDNTLDLLKDLWIKPTNKPARELYGMIPIKQKTAEVIEKKSTFYKKILIDSFNPDGLDHHSKAIDKVTSKIKLLPEEIIAGLDHLDRSMEIQRETKKEEEKELELNQLEEQGTEKLGLWLGCEFNYYDDFNNIPLEGDAIPFFPLTSYLKNDETLQQYADIFEGIDITFNVLMWLDENRSKSAKLFGQGRTPFHHLLIKEGHVIVLSQYDAQGFGKDKDYFNLTLGFLSESHDMDEKLLEKIVIVKFLNGECCYYSIKEQEILERLLNEHGKVKMKDFFHQYILSGFPVKTARYHNSLLQKIFNKKTD